MVLLPQTQLEINIILYIIYIIAVIKNNRTCFIAKHLQPFKVICTELISISRTVLKNIEDTHNGPRLFSRRIIKFHKETVCP